MSSHVTSRRVVSRPWAGGRQLEVERLAWDDSDGLSFEVNDVATLTCLTMDGAFDDHPSPGELEDAVAGRYSMEAACRVCGERVDGEGHLSGQRPGMENPWLCRDH